MIETMSLKQFLQQTTGGNRLRIVIPVIQRDYAQGRADPTVSAIRRRFLEHLRAGLEPGAKGPMVLDFVYGSQRAGRKHGESEFTPLDGQQRLTTLWLLHWYLALRENRIQDVRAFAQVADQESPSCFAYEVRPSSKEFFDALLVKTDCLPISFDSAAAPTEADRALSQAIEEQPWFLQPWAADPTVRACLTMLDAIHVHFHDGPAGSFDRLTSDENPALVFHHLDLERYGLSDDLYVRMNARGKPLTAFEVFKAELEKHLENAYAGVGYPMNGTTLTMHDYVCLRWETATATNRSWGDLFWRFKGLAGDPNTYDAEIMNLIRCIAIVSVPWCGGKVSKDACTTMDQLRGTKAKPLDDAEMQFSDLVDAGCVHQDFLQLVIHLLDTWTRWPVEHWDETARTDVALFHAALQGAQRRGDRGLDWNALVRLGAWCEGIRRGFEGPDLASWMGYFDRLAANTRFDRVDEVEPTLRSIRNFPDVPMGEMVSVVAATRGSLQRYLAQQVEEERFKAQLRIAHPDWNARLDLAEAHPWFAGQIEFLLDFSGCLELWEGGAQSCADWADEVHRQLMERFDHYHDRAVCMFGQRGLECPSKECKTEWLWERALLIFDDYLFHYEAQNFTFPLENERDRSWKRLLQGGDGYQITKARARERRRAVMKLLDQLDPGSVEASLQALIDMASTGARPFEGREQTVAWRRWLVEDVRHLKYCGKRQLCFVETVESWKQIYLMERIRRNAPHKELSAHRLLLHLKELGFAVTYPAVHDYATRHRLLVTLRGLPSPVGLYPVAARFQVEMVVAEGAIGGAQDAAHAAQHRMVDFEEVEGVLGAISRGEIWGEAEVAESVVDAIDAAGAVLTVEEEAVMGLISVGQAPWEEEIGKHDEPAAV